MKKRSLCLPVILIVTLLSIASIAFASASSEPDGERIRVFEGSIDFPAGAPFHILHGWVQTSDDGAIGIFDFKLEVDGVVLREDFKQFSADNGEPDTLWRLWVYNFPNGLTGTHTFTGHWYAPCQYAVNWLGYSGPCATPNEKIEANARKLIVTFVDPLP